MRFEEAYVGGEAAGPIWVAEVEGVPMEVQTARAFLTMSLYAAFEGVILRPSSGFRSMEEQMELWNERRDPRVRRAKGGAARPGFSRHQNGLAVDIRTGLSRLRFLAGERTETFLWLEANAPKFGFARTIPDEPWHFERVATYPLDEPPEDVVFASESGTDDLG